MGGDEADRRGGAGAGEEGAGEAVVRQGGQRGEQRVGRRVGEPRRIGQPRGDQVNAFTDHAALCVIVKKVAVHYFFFSSFESDGFVMHWICVKGKIFI